jgi:sulfide:quinone oxidoreductase
VNRSDQKQSNLVSINQLLNIAGQAQVTIIYESIASNQVSETDIIEFAKYYNQLLKPILMIWGSCTYSALLFNEVKKLGLLNE